MPFKSEKQRRFLWATNPDIARRWAHKYPESNKNLPMYADKTDNKSETADSKEKAAQINISAVISKIADSWYFPTCSILGPELNKNVKAADSKQEKVDIPHSEEPTYAGEEREKGMISSSVDSEMNVDEKKPENAINTLLQKLSVVLSPAIEQTMENLEAEREGRVPRRVGKNRGLKTYPVATPQIPLPMGMQMAAQPQQTAQTQQSKPASPTPVGAGQSSATTDPIKFHSGLSASGIINGNAALSAPNTVNTKISAAQPNKKQKKKPAKGYHLPPGPLLAGALTGSLLSKVFLRGYRNYEQGDYDNFSNDPPPWEKEFSHKTAVNNNPAMAKLMGINDQTEADLMYLIEEAEEEMFDKRAVKSAVEKWATSLKYNLPEYPYDAKLHAALQQWENTMFDEQNPTALPKNLARPLSKYMQQLQLTPRDGSAPAAMLPKGQTPDALDAIETLLELDHGKPPHKVAASTPAWQRAAGKNEEGGLNAKGRASYNRATGGNLKAPVTEKNPTGERDKRQNSFCSRMCGMKRVNTGAKTKSDPDSRINKALRKWNCKCGSEKAAQNPVPFHTGKFDWHDDPLKPDTSLVGRFSTWLTGNPSMRLDWDKIIKTQQSKAMSVSPSRASFFMQGKPEGFTRLVMPQKRSAAVNFAKAAAKRVLNLSPSWGGGKYQLGEMFLNPQVGYRYLGGVVPTPDVGLRLGGFLGGNTIGLAPLPYIETDWGRPSGWQANKETRSLYKWLGDAGRDRSTAAMHAITNLPEDAGPDDYERVMRNNAIGYSSKELKRLAERMAKIGPVALPE